MIDISQAEQQIRGILPTVTALEGTINTIGQYLIFEAITVNEAHIGDVHYQFKLFVCISSRTKNKQLVYRPLSQVLTALVEAWQQQQTVQLGTIKPHAIKGLIVYEIELLVKTECDNGELD